MLDNITPQYTERIKNMWDLYKEILRKHKIINVLQELLFLFLTYSCVFILKSIIQVTPFNRANTNKKNYCMTFRNENKDVPVNSLANRLQLCES
jgi:hypothetical protein